MIYKLKKSASENKKFGKSETLQCFNSPLFFPKALINCVNGRSSGLLRFVTFPFARIANSGFADKTCKGAYSIGKCS
jgi:hypothetical protein